MQPIEFDDHGVTRFKRNEAVRYLLDNGGIDLTQLSMLVRSGTIPEADYMQLMQLIGYSVSGYGDLAYSDDDRTEWQASADRADNLADQLIKQREQQ
jgi:hypothetical protein